MSLLAEALGTARRSGEGFCEAEILRVRAGIHRDAGRHEDAALDYADAVALARAGGGRMLELKALTGWARLPGVPEDVREELRACSAVVEAGGSSKSFDDACEVLSQS
jgi:hypothetical protein